MLKLLQKIYNWITGLKKYHAMHIAVLWSLCCILLMVIMFVYASSVDYADAPDGAGMAYGILVLLLFFLAYLGIIISFIIECINLLVFAFTHKHPKITSKILLYNKLYNIIFLAGLLCFCLFLIVFIYGFIYQFI